MDCDVVVIFFSLVRENEKSRVRIRRSVNGGEKGRWWWGGIKVRAD